MRTQAYEALRAALVVVAGCNADGAYDREEKLIRAALAEQKVSAITGDAIRLRTLGGRLFAEQLQRMFEALGSGTAGSFPHGLHGVCSMLIEKALELDGDAFEGYMLAWNWWSAVCVEGDVLQGSRLLKEIERGAA